ncbi:MAG: tetratricopeptide repeat protein [Nitrospirales bacterium]|nr:tetratricopeptide repeat protein [Nitrospirales bacterium]
MFGMIHRVLADFLRSQSGETGEETQLLSETLQTIMTPEACRDPNQWALMIACGLHGEALLMVLQDLAPKQHSPTVVRLRLLLGILHSAQGLYGRAREQEEEAVFYARTNLGEEHPDTLTSMNNLASTLSHQGEYAGAVALQRTVLERRQRILGEEHPSTLTSMNNLALTLSDQGEYAGAVALQRLVLDLRQRQLGVDHPDTLTAMGILALTLFRQGEYVEARTLQISVLERTQRILGEEHPSTSLSAWNYLNLLLQTGDTETTLDILRKYLLWLLERDPSTLGGHQQRIRAGVAKFLESAEGS